jgi:hypothetical protein
LAVETVWDAANVAMGVGSFMANVAAGNVGGAALDAVGVILDSAATVTPCVPGGAGTAIKLLRGADKAADLIKAADKANDLRKAADTANEVRKAADRGSDLAKAGDKLGDTGREVGQKTAKQTAEQGQSDAAKNATHGNKLDDKPAEAYTLRDRDTGEVKKFGETTRGEDRYGASHEHPDCRPWDPAFLHRAHP